MPKQKHPPRSNKHKVNKSCFAPVGDNSRLKKAAEPVEDSIECKSDDVAKKYINLEKDSLELSTSNSTTTGKRNDRSTLKNQNSIENPDPYTDEEPKKVNVLQIGSKQILKSSHSVKYNYGTLFEQGCPCQPDYFVGFLSSLKAASPMAQKVFLSEAEADMVQEAFRFFDIEDFQGAVQYFSCLFEMWPEKLIYKFNSIVSDFRNRAGIDSVQLLLDLTSHARQLGMLASGDKIMREDSKHPVLSYNGALIFLFYGRYDHGLKLVEKIRGSLESDLWLKKCLLLHVSLLLKTHQFVKALDVIEHYEEQRKVAMQSTNIHVDIKTEIQQYKTQCYLSSRSLRNAKRECKLLFSLTGTNHQAIHIGACLKANHDYLRGNYKKASKTMVTYFEEGTALNKSEKALNKNSSRLGMMFKNNEACCEFKMEKPNVATFQFSKALEAYEESKKHCLPMLEASRIVMYNFAISLLHIDPVKAFPKLCASMKYYNRNPRLWLRIAEACINIHKPSNNWHLNRAPENQKFLAKYIGTGDSRMISLPNLNPVKPTSHETSLNGDPVPTLEFAHVCLVNALELMKTGMKEGCISVNPSTPITDPREITCLYSAILCASAYVSLEREDYHSTIARCEELLKLKELPTGYRYLANMYLGTAYFENGQDMPSIGALFNELNCDLSFKAVVSSENNEDARDAVGWLPSSVNLNAHTISHIYRSHEWYPNDKPYAQAFLGYHQIATLAKGGQLHKATQILKFWASKFGKDLPLEFLMLGIYLHSRKGNMDVVFHLLKSNRLIDVDTA